MKRHLIIYIALLLSIVGCRTDDYIVYMEDEDIGIKTEPTDVLGMYVLNEGNMGSNKCTLDYLDLSGETAHYLRNIYAEGNPGEVKELGDVGNDANKGYAYVSSYVGPVSVSQDAPLGEVYKIDTLTLQTVAKVTVGYQPEEMAVIDDKLYVANSGGYMVPDYDHTVSVIDLKTFTEEKKIDVAVNLHRCRADQYGQLWVGSRGDYYEEPSHLCWLQRDVNGQMHKMGRIDVPISDICIVGDSLYFIGVQFNYNTMKNERTLGIIDVTTHEVTNNRMTTAPEAEAMIQPYGIIVNPNERDFYLMDAKNYVSSGDLLHFKKDGTFDYKVRTGDIPAHAVFLTKPKK